MDEERAPFTPPIFDESAFTLTPEETSAIEYGDYDWRQEIEGRRYQGDSPRPNVPKDALVDIFLEGLEKARENGSQPSS